MTYPSFRDDAYLRDAPGTVIAHTPEGGVILDNSIFYPQGGGQPGDSGVLHWEGGPLEVATTIKGDSDTIVLLPAEPQALPAIGTDLRQSLNWDRRYAHMRMHTALHLLSVVIPLPVTGGAIGAEKSRLDFAMPEPPEDKVALEQELQALIDRDLPIGETWISGTELDANPELVKTMSVKPPTGQGRVRLVRIGDIDAPVDLQPCGGTHVATSREIGQVRLGKVEKKGAQNRRVALHLVG